MNNATVLIIMGPNSDLDDLRRTIDAAQDTDFHLAVLIVGRTPTFPVYEAGIPPYGTFTVPQDWENRVKAANAALDAKLKEVTDLLADSSVSADVKVVGCEAAFIKDAIAARAMLCDLAQIESGLRQDNVVTKNVLHGLLFRSPVAVLLNTHALAKPKHAFVAWNASLPAARAVQQALPMLKAARQVTIAVFDPDLTSNTNPGSDVAKWLSHHGCTVTVQQYPSGGREIGNAILDRANEVGTDLVVAGAYSRSKLREDIFGGTSKILIDQTDTPVLLAH